MSFLGRKDHKIALFEGVHSPVPGAVTGTYVDERDGRLVRQELCDLERDQLGTDELCITCPARACSSATRLALEQVFIDLNRGAKPNRDLVDDMLALYDAPVADSDRVDSCLWSRIGGVSDPQADS